MIFLFAIPIEDRKECNVLSLPVRNGEKDAVFACKKERNMVEYKVKNKGV